MKRVVYRFLLGALFILLSGIKLMYAGGVQADTGISDFSGLKEALEQGGTKTISLAADIPLAAEIQVKGRKTIAGKGHTLYRNSGNHQNLFVVQDASLTIQDVCISGKKERQKESITAFWIGQKGTVTMDGGKIVEHYNAAGGPAVRIEPEGCFEIREGAIQGNKAIATGTIRGKDARGGAIANAGSCILTGGMLSGNEAVGSRRGVVNFGGLGGMLYNQGTCVVRDAVIKDNGATSAGMDMYHEKGAVCREEKESVSPTPDSQDGEPETAGNQAVEQEKEKISGKTRRTKQPGNTGKPADTKKAADTDKPVNEDKPVKTEGEASTEKTAKKEKTQETGVQGPENDRGARYLFQWEIRAYTEADWRRELLDGCKSLRGEEIQWNWNGLLTNKQGKYIVRAATGSGVEHVIPVTIVSGNRQSEKRTRRIRFCEPEERDGEKQTWRFLSRDIKAVKEELRRQNNLFSREANQTFLKEFGRCRKG